MTKKIIPATIVIAIFVTAVLACGGKEQESPSDVRATQVAFMEQRNYQMSTPPPTSAPPSPTATPTLDERNKALVLSSEKTVKATTSRRLEDMEKREAMRKAAEPVMKQVSSGSGGGGAGSGYCRKHENLVLHALGVPGVNIEGCSFELSSIRLSISQDCEKNGVTDGWTSWKVRPTPVNHHVHDHDETHEQEELVLKCGRRTRKTGIDVRSTQQMVVFMSDHDELYHSHWHGHGRDEAGAHPHRHRLHEDDPDGEHLHDHDDHRHYGGAGVR